MFGSIPNFIKKFLCPFLQGYKLRILLVDCCHRHSRPKNLGKEGETILLESWFCSILPQSLNVRNTTEQNTLALLCTRNLFYAQKIKLEVLRVETINFTPQKQICD